MASSITVRPSTEVPQEWIFEGKDLPPLFYTFHFQVEGKEGWIFRSRFFGENAALEQKTLFCQGKFSFRALKDAKKMMVVAYAGNVAIWSAETPVQEDGSFVINLER